MTDIRSGEFHDGEILEVNGNEFCLCHFFDCELVGVGGLFRDCVFVNSLFGNNGASFESCLFLSGDG